MTRRFHAGVLATVLLTGMSVFATTATPLRVCADPSDLPFSNDRRQGFENQLADLVARSLGTTVAYTWQPQREGFLTSTLLAKKCDVVMGYPAGMPQVAATQPYYRSTYVWVSQRSRALGIRSYDDPRLRTLRVGVQLSGDDPKSPPAQALARRGIPAGRLVGYIGVGDEHGSAPPSAIVSAVARGSIDVAAVWGPLGGYYAAQQRVPLTVTPVAPEIDGGVPQAFDITMATRRDDAQRLTQLNRFIRTHQRDIAALLDRFHIPRVERSS